MGIGAMQKRLEIVVETIMKGEAELVGQTNQLLKYQESLNKIRAAERAGQDVNKTKKAQDQNNIDSIRQLNAVSRNGLKIKKLEEKSLGRLIKEQSHFKMELLGVMFFAMGVNRIIKGMLKPSMEAAKVFELWGMIMKMMFLPEAIEVRKKLMEMWTWYNKLPKPMQEMFKDIVIGTGIIATFVGFLAVMGLGLHSLLIAFEKGTLLAGLKNLSTIMKGLTPFVGIVVAIDGIKKLSEGKVIDGIAETMLGAGLFLKGHFGKMMLFTGLALQIGKMIVKGESLTQQGLLANLATAFAISRLWKFSPTLGLIAVAALVINELIFQWPSIKADIDAASQKIANMFNLSLPKIKVWIPFINEVAWIKPEVTKMKTGGYVNEDKMALLHAGEYVLPSNRTTGLGGSTNITFSPNIHVTGNSRVDIEHLKSQLTDSLVSEIERRIRT